MSKKDLSEQDIRTRYITPAIITSGWDLHTQIREEVTFTASRIKTKPMRIEKISPKKAWRGNSEESEQAWKVSVEQIKANDYNLDIKNPNIVEADLGDPDELLAEYKTLLADVATTREALKQELMAALERGE
ncbi:MAG: N-6 DNA methylase [Desulfuromusa sp.]|nr:N-6 DNA methylase [Desulfuromusa sp.]